MKIIRTMFKTKYCISTDLNLIVFRENGRVFIDTSHPCEVTTTDGVIHKGNVLYPGIEITRKYAAEKLKEWKNENK